MLYRNILSPFIFRIYNKDPEVAHEHVIALLNNLGKNSWITEAIRKIFSVEDVRLEQNLLGLKFLNPVGLAAGFDKNAIAIHALAALGFGLIEVGTITRHQQNDVPRPRILRLPKHKAIINWMGFNNEGADEIAGRLADAKRIGVPLGINLGKSKITSLEEVAADYLYSLSLLYPYGDYFVINVSSPNTLGLRKLQDKGRLDNLLKAIMSEATSLSEQKGKRRKPIFVKVAPDLEWKAIDELLQVCTDNSVDGIIATNTTIDHSGLSDKVPEICGLSGRPLFPRAVSIVRHIRKQLPDMVIIGVGGIFTCGDAYAMFKAGANLLQILTSLIYEGPFVVKKINQGLVRLMERDGINHLSELSP